MVKWNLIKIHNEMESNIALTAPIKRIQSEFEY